MPNVQINLANGPSAPESDTTDAIGPGDVRRSDPDDDEPAELRRLGDAAHRLCRSLRHPVAGSRRALLARTGADAPTRDAQDLPAGDDLRAAEEVRRVELHRCGQRHHLFEPPRGIEDVFLHLAAADGDHPRQQRQRAARSGAQLHRHRHGHGLHQRLELADGPGELSDELDARPSSSRLPRRRSTRPCRRSRVLRRSARR